MPPLPPPPQPLALSSLPSSPTRQCQIFREVKFFGDAEIQTLRKELESHKLQLEQLKQVGAGRELALDYSLLLVVGLLTVPSFNCLPGRSPPLPPAYPCSPTTRRP